MNPLPEQPSTSAPAPHPTYKAMLVCDMTIRDATTGKVSLIGLFADINARAFPARHGLLCVYARIGDARGAYKLRLELVRTDDMHTIGLGEVSVDLPDRLGVAEIDFQLNNLVFERPGRYGFRLFANDRYLGSEDFTVEKLEE